ncbi:MAG TPA: Hsp70 family protein, partial [Planctomycetota bacterium]|nr:Hsp70 family protein [Planctomycetota bacterium]
IPPAPRGVPKIEVTFDLDANGILHVTAQDLGTGKENKIEIKSSSGLSQDEVKRMQREAEEHASEDAKKKEAIELRNKADSLSYQMEKMLKEHGDKIPADDRKKVEEKAAELKKLVESKSEDTEQLKRVMDELEQVSHALAKAMYEKVGGRPGGEGGAPEEPTMGGPRGEQAAGGPKSATGAKKGGDDDIIDADYEVKS